MKLKYCIILFCVFDLSNSLTAQMLDSIQEITISDSRLIQSTLLDQSTLNLKKDAITNARGFALGDALQNQSAVFATSTENFSQDLRLSIRGFGMRSAFGIRGIKIVVDGVPESTPDGQGDVDNVEPLTLANISVQSGPANSTYANASGGVVELTTLMPTKKFQANLNAVIGEYGMQKSHVLIGSKTKFNQTIASLSLSEFNGYRQNSAYKNTNFFVKSEFKIREKSKLRLTISGFDSPYAYDPGGLTDEQVKVDRRMARLQNVTFKAGEKLQQIRGVLYFSHRLSELTTLQSSLHTTSRTFSNLLPFANGGAVSFDRSFQTAFLALTRKNIFFSQDQLVLGLDWEAQKDYRQRKDNNAAAVLRLDQDEHFKATGAYINYLKKQHKVIFNSSIRIDQFQIELSDRFLSDGNQSATTNYLPLSGFLNIGYELSKDINTSFKISSGFETPSLTEILNNPTGSGFADVDPARTNGVELNLDWKNNYGNVMLSTYHYSSSNELIPFQIVGQEGRIFYKNGGESMRTGLELGTSLAISSFLDLNLNTSIANFELKTTDKKLPGLPLKIANLAIPIHNKSRSLELIPSIRFLGSIYADDNNLIAVAPQKSANLFLQYTFNYKNMKARYFASMTKAISSSFYSNILINALGNRYYEPAPPSFIYGGIGLEF